jgi:hypothetical protein
LVRRWVWALAFCAIASTAGAQTQPADGAFQPQVGQDGKDVVWVPTPQALVDKMLDMAQVTPQDVVMDLGSGDGRTVITAAKRGARAIGIEYDLDMVDLSRGAAAREGVADKATFVGADLFEADFSQATVVTMFLLTSINLKLRPKILDLTPGTRVVSNTFTMEEWEPDETATIIDNCTRWCTALFWIVPAKVAGTWRLPQGELTLTQKFQMVSGTLTSGTSSIQIASGRLRGDQITFTAGAAQYAGRVNGNLIQGTFTSGAEKANWTANRAGN